MTYHHANPRFYIGPNTNEVIVEIGRAYGVTVGNAATPLVIKFKKRSMPSNIDSTWTSYVVKNGFAHFEIPEPFRTGASDYPVGFYDGEVTIGDCVIGEVELIKAPGHYLMDGQSVQDKCHGEDTWVEPECPTGEVTKPCGCGYSDKSQCPSCYNEVTVAKIGLLADYAGLYELQECSPTDDEES